MNEKLTLNDEGKVFKAVIEHVFDDSKGLYIFLTHNGEKYVSKRLYSSILNSTAGETAHIDETYIDIEKRQRVYNKFENMFGFPVEEAEKAEGVTVTCVVKVAFKKYPYIDILQVDK